VAYLQLLDYLLPVLLSLHISALTFSCLLCHANNCISVVIMYVCSQYVCHCLVLLQASECLAFVSSHAMNWLTFLATASVSCRQEILIWLSKMSPHTHTYTHLTALYLGLPGWAGTRKVKPIWIILKQETVSGSGIRWAICKSAPRSRQITMPAPHRSVFYRPDALPVTQPKHWSVKALKANRSIIWSQQSASILKVYLIWNKI